MKPTISSFELLRILTLDIEEFEVVTYQRTKACYLVTIELNDKF